MRWLVAGGLTWFGLFGLAFGLWYADEVGAFRNCYLKVRTPSRGTVWVQFKGNHLRTASSPGALPQSKWVRAVQTDWEHTAFPDVVLSPAKDEPDSELRARFDLYGTDCEIAWAITRRDRDGTSWTYVVEDAADVETARRPDQSPAMTAPDLQQLALAIETQPEMEGEDLKLGVGLHVTSMQQRNLEVTDIRKEGKSTPARIEIKNETGKLVLTEEKPLSELGFT